MDSGAAAATPSAARTRRRDAASGPSNLFIRRHDVSIVPAGSGLLEGDVKHVRAFGPTQRADVVLHNGATETLIEIDAPRDRDLKPGERSGQSA